MKGWSPRRICKHFRQEFGLLLYPGDVFSYLDAMIHNLEAIERIAQVFCKEEVIQRVSNIKKQIEG
jgi:helicase